MRMRGGKRTVSWVQRAALAVTLATMVSGIGSIGQVHADNGTVKIDIVGSTTTDSNTPQVPCNTPFEFVGDGFDVGGNQYLSTYLVTGSSTVALNQVQSTSSGNSSTVIGPENANGGTTTPGNSAVTHPYPLAGAASNSNATLNVTADQTSNYTIFQVDATGAFTSPVYTISSTVPGVMQFHISVNSATNGGVTNLFHSGDKQKDFKVDCTNIGAGGGPGPTATPELGSGELMIAGVLPILAIPLYRRYRRNRANRARR